MNRSTAQIVREYGPFPGADHVHGVTYDGQRVWFAAGDKLIAFDPASAKALRSIEVPAHAGTAFDGRHLYQIVEDRIHKIDPATGRVLAAIPAPGSGGNSGLAWAEGTLWVGQYRDRKIYQVDPQTGAILRTIESRRFVTGVTWVDGELGTAPGKVTRAICGESIPEPEKFWRRSRCRRECSFRGSSPMAAISSSAAEEGAGRCGPSAAPSEAPRASNQPSRGPDPEGGQTRFRIFRPFHHRIRTERRSEPASP